MAWFGRLSLQKKIGLLVFFGLAVGLGLFSWLGIKSINESTQQVLNERLSIARITAHHIDETLAHLLLHMEDFAHAKNAPPTQAEFSAAADSLHRLFSVSDVSIKNIILTDSQGKSIQVVPDNTAFAGLDLSQFAEVKQVLDTGGPVISNLITDPKIGAPVALVIVPIANDKHEIIGLIAAAVQIQSSSIRELGKMMEIGNTGYVEVVDRNGMVIARTDPGIPLSVDEKSDHAGHFSELIAQGLTTVETSQGLRGGRDVIAFAPLASASWGIAIRQSEAEALAPTQQLETRLFLLGMTVLLITALLAWIMMRGIVKPVKMLTTAAKRVAAGDLQTVVTVRQGDEIGELSAAFGTMTQELAKSRDELMSRNEELLALNSIAATVNQYLNIGDVLENALQRVLEITKTNTGCVMLWDSNKSRLGMMKYTGAVNSFECQEAGSSASNCACRQVIKSGQTMMVNDVTQCSMLGEATRTKNGIEYFVSVPLKSKNRTLGVMNIAGHGDHCFSENDFRLLDSIGYHIGLAIENSFLYDAAKQKEELRGQLLNRVIIAQEEERKRIARELHDEYGQTLTGLVMSIEMLENLALPTQPQIKERLKDAKSLVGRAISDIRRLTLDLRPSSLDYLGLVDTVRMYSRTHLEALGINVQFESSGLSQRLDSVVEVALFRIIQEAINNITKYAEAHNVKIKLESKGEKIVVLIEDDGKGFDAEFILENRNERKSLGLLGIEERVTLLGGTFSINSQIGRGTRLTIAIPLNQAVKVAAES